MHLFGQSVPFATAFFLLLALGLALSFEFVNGFHDTANAVATVIYTHSLDPNIAVVNFGAAAVYNLRSDGTLRVIADVEVANKTFTVDAADDSIARQKAAAQLTAEEQRILIIDDVKKLSAGKFRVAMSIPTKKILMRTPQAVRVVY